MSLLRPFILFLALISSAAGLPSLADQKPAATHAEPASAAPEPQPAPSEQNWREGIHYERLASPPVTRERGTVEVLEFFWYGCAHCYALEPYLRDWLVRKPAYLKFVRIPIAWGPMDTPHARLFYTLKALGREDLHATIFDTMHVQHNPLYVLNDEDRTFALQRTFVTEQGIDGARFLRAWRSAQVTHSVDDARRLAQQYKVDAVPTMVIDGRYKTDMRRAGGPTQLLTLVDLLAEQDHTSVSPPSSGNRSRLPDGRR
jgi:protein dithiol oxidoreductase (disulfide-forming)